MPHAWCREYETSPMSEHPWKVGKTKSGLSKRNKYNGKIVRKMLPFATQPKRNKEGKQTGKKLNENGVKQKQSLNEENNVEYTHKNRMA